MSRYVIPVRSPEEAFKHQQGVQEKIRRGMRVAQLDAALALEAILVQDTRSEGLTDTGLLVGSWAHHETRAGVEVSNDAPYAGPRLELGARPFTPPLQPLIDWAERKAGDLGIAQVPKGKTFPGRASLTDPQRKAALKIAKAIQRKYAKEGIKPRYLMRNRIPYALRQLARATREQIEIAARP